MSDIDHEQAPDLPIGARLRLAREERGLSLDEVASRTRIPVRHLQHIESGDWDALPAITYCVGFVRSYANEIGLDGSALGGELRDQLGGSRRTGAVADYYEPADPARVPPRWLAIAAAIIAIALIAGYLIFRSGIDDAERVASTPPAAPAQNAAPKAQPQPAAAPQDPTGQQVTLSATEEVWLRVYEAGGQKLFEGILAPGQQYRIPPGAQRPQLLTGRPNALQVTVGATAIPQLGPAERSVRDVSLAPADLIAFAQRGGSAAPSPGTPPTP
jgi:transcriptional regulator with XRE-family HTH domain